MSESNPGKHEEGAEGLRAVEAFWHARPPTAFRRLYREYPAPFLAPCEFFTLDAIARGEGRAFGQLPQYLPFGQAVDEGGTYGFYVTPESVLGRWPVLYLDAEEGFLRPVASDFDAFLRHCFLVGRYETEEQWLEGGTDREEESERRDFLRRLNLPEELLQVAVPRSDTELYAYLASSDEQDAVSLCHLGNGQRAARNEERALDFFHRAAEAAPWFGDPAYLIADVYREREEYARAIECYARVVEKLLPLCTRTWEWDLGVGHPGADIYEVAADALAQWSEHAEPGLRQSPLWKAVVEEDPYDPDVRERLAASLLAANDIMSAEREYLNALTLASRESGPQPRRCYDALMALYERAGRVRDAALARFDRALPRS